VAANVNNNLRSSHFTIKFAWYKSAFNALHVFRIHWESGHL
jgi:hypothetical protein